MESKASTRRQQIGQIEPDQVPPLGSQKLAYTVPEFCAATGIGRTSVYEEIAAGRLKAIKAAGRRLILHQDGAAWLRSCRDAA
jgi:excisionase family DNA binding protein